MSGTYAYLVVEQRSFRLPLPRPAEKARDGNDAIAGRVLTSDELRSALSEAASLAGYGSIETLMASKRTLRSTGTPARAKHVRLLFEVGRLNHKDAGLVRLLDASAIPDVLWDVLGRIDPKTGRVSPADPTPRPAAPRPTHKEISSWAITMISSEQGEISIEVDPEQTPGSRLPLSLILRTLNELVANGWRVIDLSEDHAINDDASASFVTGQRYLLQRD